jgi:hypothetical protein
MILFSNVIYSEQETLNRVMNEMQHIYDEEEQAIFSRMLAKDYLPVKIDYSVLSVAVMTLGLIMIVEVIRHRIDHAALNKPFFQAVLNGVNSECKWK